MTKASMRISPKIRFASPDMANYELPRWPPPPNFPIVVGNRGKVESLYRYHVWNISVWFGERTLLNFGDSGQEYKKRPTIDSENGNLLRQVVAFWMYRDEWYPSPAAIKTDFNFLRKVFVICSREGVRADRLVDYPKVAHGIAREISPHMQLGVLRILDRLFVQRKALGFTILDAEGLRRFAASRETYHPSQTPYIPPRIWRYQGQRVHDYIADYLDHKEGFEQLHAKCMSAYIAAYGIRGAFIYARGESKNPFCYSRPKGQPSFAELADEFDVSTIIRRWIVDPQSKRPLVISNFQAYLTCLTQVGAISIADQSLARISEINTMRSDCVVLEKDEEFGTFYLLRGLPSKKGDDAEELVHWVTGPNIEATVAAMSSVSSLRMRAAALNPFVQIPKGDITNPYLICRSFEPWVSKNRKDRDIGAQLFSKMLICTFVECFPYIFEDAQMTITQEDLELARYVTPSLSPEKFDVGKVWRLAFHQYRRTGAVNMQASGLVSDDSIQYQLKHEQIATSLYYGRGYSTVLLERDATEEYRKTMYEMIARQYAELDGDRYISPYGVTHKKRFLDAISLRDEARIKDAVKNGEISCRPTLLGRCLNCMDCEYGGIDNLVACIGDDEEDACPEALLDVSKLSEFYDMEDDLIHRLKKVDVGSPLEKALTSELKSVRKAIRNVEQFQNQPKQQSQQIRSGV